MVAQRISSKQYKKETEDNSALIHRAGNMVKAIGTDDQYGWVEGYLVSWGNNGDTDLQGEHFSPRTEFCLDWFTERPVLYHHGMDNSTGLRKIGMIKSVEPDDIGLWVQAQLDLRDRYANAVYDMVKSKEFGWSSGSVDHLVKISQKGEIMVWPIIEGSITPTPAQPSKTTVRAFKAIMSEDQQSGQYLRELDRVYNEIEARVNSPDYDPQKYFSVIGVNDKDIGAQKNVQLGSKNSLLGDNMAKKSSYRIARQVAKALGIRDISPDELQAVADTIEPDVQDEISQAAAEDAETNAALASLEDEMTGAATQSVRRYRAANRRATRKDGYDDDMIAGVADNLATQMEKDFADQLQEDQLVSKASRAIIQRAYARASQKLDALSDIRGDLTSIPVVPAGGGDTVDHLGDFASTGSKRMAVRQNEFDPEEDAQAAEDLLDNVATNAYNKGYLAGMKRAIRSDGDRVEEADVQIDADKSAWKDGIGDDDDDLESAMASYRKGYLAAVNSRKDLPLDDDDDAAMGNDYFGQDDPATMDDSGLMEEELTGKSYTNNARKSAEFGNNVEQDAAYWKRRAVKAELGEARGERQFGSIERVTDVADRQGSYEHAFKSYIYRGDRFLSETEKYVLMGKGRANWGAGSFEYDQQNGSIKSAAQKTYYGGNDASVGFTVPPDWVSELNKNIMTETVMAPECRTRTTTSDQIVQNSLNTTDARRAHAARVRWPGETITAGSEHRTTEDSYYQVQIPIHVMLLSVAASNSSLEDVTFSLEDEINEAFSEAVGVAYDSLIWSGDGQGKLQGIVTSTRVTGSASTGVSSVSGYVPSGSTDGIVNADVLKTMLFHLPRGYRSKAKWYMNSNTGLQIAQLKDGMGRYLIDQNDESLKVAGVPDVLLGHPIVYNEYADDIATNAFPLVLGDLQRSYVIGKRVDFSIRRFDDSAQADLDQVLFIGRARLGGQIIQPAGVKVLKIAVS